MKAKKIRARLGKLIGMQVSLYGSYDAAGTLWYSGDGDEFFVSREDDTLCCDVKCTRLVRGNHIELESAPTTRPKEIKVKARTVALDTGALRMLPHAYELDRLRAGVKCKCWFFGTALGNYSRRPVVLCTRKEEAFLLFLPAGSFFIRGPRLTIIPWNVEVGHAILRGG